MEEIEAFKTATREEIIVIDPDVLNNIPSEFLDAFIDDMTTDPLKTFLDLQSCNYPV
jgi:hypothetical protein